MFKELKDSLLLNLTLGNWSFNYNNTSFSVLGKNRTYLSFILIKESNEIAIQVYTERPDLYCAHYSIFTSTSLISSCPFIISNTDNEFEFKQQYVLKSPYIEYKYISINNKLKSVHFHNYILDSGENIISIKEYNKFLGYLK